MHSPSLYLLQKRHKNKFKVKTHVLSRLSGRIGHVCAGNGLMARAVPGRGWLEHVPKGLEEVLAGAGSLLSHGGGMWSPPGKGRLGGKLSSQTPVPDHSAGKQRDFGMFLAHSL